MISFWKTTCLLIAFCRTSAILQAGDFQGASHLFPFDEDGVGYSKAEADNAITHLQKKIETGAVKLEYTPEFGYLKALLKELEIPESSQMLVFSKTSMQREKINPHNPRAIFYNDNIYVGYIP